MVQSNNPGRSLIIAEEGQPIYDKIAGALSQEEEVTLDFAGVTFLTTAFLNVVIGTLYKDYTSEQLRAMLHVVNANDETVACIKTSGYILMIPILQGRNCRSL